MFSYFDATAAVTFAEALAGDFHQFFTEEARNSNRAGGQKPGQRFGAMIERTIAFSRQNKLNIYKKGKFLTVLKYRLKELGHTEEETQQALKALLPYV